MLLTRNYIVKSFKLSRSISIAVLAEIKANPPLVANAAVHKATSAAEAAAMPAFVPAITVDTSQGLLVSEINHAHLMPIVATVRNRIAKIRAAVNHPLGRVLAARVNRLRANAPVGVKHRQTERALVEVQP